MTRTITYKCILTQKELYKKADAIFSIFGKNGINPWHFFLNSHLGLSRSLRSNENRGWFFEAATSNFCNHSWIFGSSPRNGKVDFCNTNGSKVLIYLTLISFFLHYVQEWKQLGLKYIKTPARIVDYAMQKHWLTEYFLQPSLPKQYMYYDSKLLTNL